MLTNQKCYLQGLDDKLTTLALLWKKYLVMLDMANRTYDDKFYLSEFTCEPAFLARRSGCLETGLTSELFQPYPVTFLHRFDLEKS